jgi:hypothetical protein
MRLDRFHIIDASTSDPTRVERDIDQRICIVARLGERLASGTPPELARLDSIEIGRHRDTLAKKREQRRVTRVRREIRSDALCVEKVIDAAIDTINTERARRRLEYHKFLTVGIFDAFDPERI